MKRNEESRPQPTPATPSATQTPDAPQTPSTWEEGGRLEGLAGLAILLEEEAESLVEHLDELRWRLIVCLAAFVLCCAAGWLLVPGTLAYFEASVGRLIYVAPAEAFFSRLKIAATLGFVLSSPITLFQAWRFVLPALFPEEKRALRALLWMGALLFVGGLAFGVFAAYPISLRFFLNFGTDDLRPAIVVSRHLGFFLGTTVSFGLAFQLPVVLMILVRLGVVEARRLRAMRKEAVFFAFVVGALLTPADAVSQTLMAIPLFLLYELSARIAPWFERRQGAL